ncbi:MAG: hypothetical protein IPO22_02120 [Anaerolineales bacterium]|nr:hypothetical protein [Anaerolineales bacterium]
MTRTLYVVPTRGLLGFAKNSSHPPVVKVLFTPFSAGYDEMAGPINSRHETSIIAWEAGDHCLF